MDKTVRYWVQAYPFASQDGYIDVPADIPANKVENYIRENFDDIEFEEPDLHYGGTEFEFGEE